MFEPAARCRGGAMGGRSARTRQQRQDAEAQVPSMPSAPACNGLCSTERLFVSDSKVRVIDRPPIQRVSERPHEALRTGSYIVSLIIFLP